jgi:peptidoglycan/LPS O-acetylase OafA/YrhL
MEKNFIKALNGLRGWAFINVLFEHTFLYLTIIPIAQPAVTLFFVLSGYLLSLQIYSKLQKNQKINLINYFIKRIFRIYPCFILAIFLDIIVGRINFKMGLRLLGLIDVFKQYWTIYVEMRSYLLIPLICFIYYKINSLAVKISSMILIISLSIYWHFYITFLAESPYSIYYFIDQDYGDLKRNLVFFYLLPLFLIGIFAAIIYYHFSQKIKKISCYNLTGFISLILATSNVIMVLCLGLYKYIVGHLPKNIVGTQNFVIYFAVGYFFLVILVSDGNNFFIKIMNSKLFQFFGNISYPGYLIHMITNYTLVIHFDFNPKENFLKFVSYTIPISLIISYIMHLTVEKYFIKISKNVCLPSYKNLLKNEDTNKYKSLESPSVRTVNNDFEMNIQK